MKKKILIALLILMLPAFVIINSLADNSNDHDENVNVEVNNDIMINSPLFTKPESTIQYVQPEVNMTSDGFEFVTKKGDLSLYTNPKNGSIRIQNDVTKFVWASDVLGMSNYKIGFEIRTRYQTAFSVLYRDAENYAYRDVYSMNKSVKLTLNKNESGLTYSVRINGTSEESYIAFDYNVLLTETGIDVKIPHESIVEAGGNYICEISLFPNFGAVFGSSVPGYIFVPSGNGGLIRFDSKPAINAAYIRPYYGSDANRNKTGDNNDEVGMSLPIYGIAQGVGGNAVLATIKSGSGFANFNYEPSSTTKFNNTVLNMEDGFHRVFNTFNYRETYTLSFGTDIFMKPENIYKQDVEMNYTFLTDSEADYIGMAHAYQKQLKERDVLHKNSSSGSGNVHLDVLGGETEKGIVVDKFVKMTTTEQLKEINDELTKKFSNKFLYTLRGYYKDGYSRQTASNIKFDGRLGSLKDLEELDYYIYYNPIESYNSKESTDGSSLVNIYNQRYCLEVEEGSKYKTYANVDVVSDGITKALDKYKNSLAIDGLYRLYGDYNNEYDRYQVMQMYDGLISDTMPMFKPNEYMLSDTSHYLNMPLYHDRSRFITDSVPFLQILLRGYVDYYSTYLNFSTNQEIDLLKCIEYGSNLAYLISAEESYLIANTLSSHLYATHYNSNKKLIFEQINDASVALNQVIGQEIENRVVLAIGVVEVTYGNGVRIYVNYTNKPYTYGNVEIPEMDYKVVS